MGLPDAVHSSPRDESFLVIRARRLHCKTRSSSLVVMLQCTVGLFVVLAGDAIKSVKPYFGLGVNTAFEDCVALDRYEIDARGSLTVFSRWAFGPGINSLYNSDLPE